MHVLHIRAKYTHEKAFAYKQAFTVNKKKYPNRRRSEFARQKFVNSNQKVWFSVFKERCILKFQKNPKI